MVLKKRMRELMEMMVRSQEPCMQIICMYIYIEQESKIQKLCGAWSMGKLNWCFWKACPDMHGFKS